MISGIFKLVDGAYGQQLRFENIANNLANINTNGFKKSVISFDQALSMTEFSKIDLSPGPVVHTGNQLDVALDGKGFFKVMTSNGTRYTRDGAFSINSKGVLITRNGDQVLGENGPITISGSDISIGRDGQVGVDGSQIDKLSIVDFTDSRFLKKEGGSNYVYNGAESDIIATDNPNVQQHYLEKSNVDPAEEMIKMIETYRTFESIQKAIQNMDEVTSKMVNDPDLL